MTASTEVRDYVASLPSRAHAVLVYDADRTLADVLCAFAKGGLARNQLVLLVGTSREDFAGAFESGGLDFLGLEKTGNVSFQPVADVFSEHGRFRSLEEIGGRLARLAASRDPATPARAFVCADSFFDYGSAQDVVRLERGVGETFPIPVSGICAYDAEEFDKHGFELLTELLHAHGHSLFRGLAFSKS